MRRVLDLFNEKGTRDELRFLNLQIALSDELFPGTTYLLTRLRYVLFIPWICKSMEEKRTGGNKVVEEARVREIELINQLKKTETEGVVIGVQADKSCRCCQAELTGNRL